MGYSMIVYYQKNGHAKNTKIMMLLHNICFHKSATIVYFDFLKHVFNCIFFSFLRLTVVLLVALSSLKHHPFSFL